MKNEILERMNEKRNHLHSFAHFKFSGLFFERRQIITIERAKTSRTSKNILFNSWNIVEDGLGQNTYSSTVRT